MTALVTKHLPLLSDAPDGIRRIRQLIVDLAVSGKLIPQGSTDDWPQVQLSDIVTSFQNGVSSRGAANGQAVAVLRLADIKSGEISLGDLRTLMLDAETIEKYLLVDGDMLVIRVNGSADLVGRFIVHRESGGALHCDHFIRLRLDRERIEPRFLKLIGDCSSTRASIQGRFVSTAGQKTVNQGHIGSLAVPLPPLAKQHRIVAKVDELMALCDRLEADQADAEAAHAQLVQALLDSLTQATDAADFRASWQRLSENFHILFTTEASIDALKQAVLQLAVMGKLVPQSSNDEHASILLQRAEAEKNRMVADGRSRKGRSTSCDALSDLPFNVPQGWAWAKMSDVLHFLNGYAFKSEWFCPHGVRLLRNINVGHGVLDWRETVCITNEMAAEFTAFSLNVGDLVLTLDRPIISTGLKVAVLSPADLPCLLLQRVAKLSSYAGVVSTSYLSIWLNSAFFIDAIDPGRSNGVPHISTTQVGAMSISLPPLAEQRRIVAKVDELMALCDQLKAQLAETRQQHAQLATALVEQAVA